VYYLVVQNDQVPILKVESVQFIARGLGVHDIFIDNERGSLGVVCDSLTDLAELLVSLEVSTEDSC
jgi:hypothetical protein